MTTRAPSSRIAGGACASAADPLVHRRSASTPTTHRPADGYAVGGEASSCGPKKVFAKRTDRGMPGADSALGPELERVHHRDCRTGDSGRATRGSGDMKGGLAGSADWNSCGPQGLVQYGGGADDGRKRAVCGSRPARRRRSCTATQGSRRGDCWQTETRMSSDWVVISHRLMTSVLVHNPWKRDDVAGGSSGGL